MRILHGKQLLFPQRENPSMRCVTGSKSRVLVTGVLVERKKEKMFTVHIKLVKKCGF